jgi:hypothetical protein
MGITVWVALLLALLGCGGGSPAPQPSPVTPSTPPSSSAFSITALSPWSVDAGGDGLTLTISGKGFVDDLEFESRVVWTPQGTPTNLTVTAASTTQIIATAPAALLRNPDTVQIAIEKYDRAAGKVAARSQVYCRGGHASH